MHEGAHLEDKFPIQIFDQVINVNLRLPERVIMVSSCSCPEDSPLSRNKSTNEDCRVNGHVLANNQSGHSFLQIMSANIYAVDTHSRRVCAGNCVDYF